MAVTAGVVACSIPTSSAAPLAEGETGAWIHVVTEVYQELPGGYAPYSDLGNVYGTGSLLGLSLSCATGVQCPAERPVQLQEIRAGKTRIVRSGVVSDFSSDYRSWETYRDITTVFPGVNTRRPAMLAYRWLLPEWNGLPALRSNVREFDIRRATKVRVTVTDGVWDPEGYGEGVFHYCVRRVNDRIPMVTLRISPASPTREGYYEYAEDGRVVAERLLSNRHGVFRFPGPKDFQDARIIRVPATKKLAGFSVTFDPCPQVAR